MLILVRVGSQQLRGCKGSKKRLHLVGRRCGQSAAGMLLKGIGRWLLTPQEARQPANDVGVQLGIGEFGQEGWMVDAVKGFVVVYYNGC